MDSMPMITIVDDDESVRDATVSLIRAAGFNPKSYPCARAFLDSGDMSITDFLIADVQMPGMSGLELFGALRQAGKSIPTVLITAYPDEKLRARALREGIAGYFTKPFNANELLDCIQSILNSGLSRSTQS